LELVEKRLFLHNSIKYGLCWVKERHQKKEIVNLYGRKLLNYYDYVCSNEYPEEIFNDSGITRCSKFRIKGLQKDARKKIAISLIKSGMIKVIDDNNKPANISPKLSKLYKMARIWFSIYSKTMGKNPGHEPILEKILKLNNSALAIEIPIWTTSHHPQTNNYLKEKQFSCISNEVLTGHIDLILYDEYDHSLVVADYKPENYFLRSLAQVATYGLVLKRILNYEKVKCVSFSKDKIWIYDPEIVRKVIPQYLNQYGNPNLIWRSILPSI